MKSWISVALLTFVCFFQKGECAIQSWTVPSIATLDGGNGALTTTIDDGITAVTGTLTITATTDTSDSSLAYTLVSQTPSGGSEVVFAVAGGTGDITITSGTVAYATTPAYTFVVSATDSGNSPVTATVTLSVNDLPAFSATMYGYCIADASASGTTLTTLTATDAVNGGSLTYSIVAGGNTNTDWAISSAGVITTANALAASTTPGYALVLNAADSTLTGSSTVFIYVGSCSSGATAIVVGSITLLMAFIAHLY